MANKIQIKRGNIADLPIYLDAGEFGLAVDTGRLFIGDGTTNLEIGLMSNVWDIFDANTILAADVDNTPTARTINEQQVVGRLTGGNIGGIDIGITYNDIVQIDTATNPIVDNDYAKFTANGLEGRSYTNVLADLSGQAGANFSMNGYLLREGTAPLLDDDYVIKSYVDGLAAGVKNKSVADVYADTNITLSGLQTIDGVALTDGEQVLIAEHQTSGTETGLWVVRATAWERAPEWGVGEEVGAYFVFIKGGTEDGNGFIVTNDDGNDVVGTNTIVFVQFSQAGGGANKQLSNLEDTVAVSKSLIPLEAGKDLGSGSIPWDDLFLKSGGIINFGNGNAQIVHSTGKLDIGSSNFGCTGNIGATASYIAFSSPNEMDITIGSVTHDIVSISDGAADNDKLVTQGYVDDLVGGKDAFIELEDVDVGSHSYSGHAYDLVRVNAAATAMEFMSGIDGGTF